MASPFRLDGKVALVTGAGRGIGASIAVELARAGAKVIVNYANSSGPAEKVVAEIKGLGSDAVAIQANVREVKETVRLFEAAKAHYGQLDIVVSNAGVVSFGHLGEVTEVSFPSRNVCGWNGILTCMGIKGGIRPRLQPQHARPVFCRSRGLQAPRPGRAHHPDELEHRRGLRGAKTLALLCLEGCHRVLRAVPGGRLRQEEDHGECHRAGRYRDGHVPRHRERLPPSQRENV